MKAELKNVNGHPVLAIEIPVSKRPSMSGKTTVVASTNGNKATSIIIDDQPVIIGFNAYIKR